MYLIFPLINMSKVGADYRVTLPGDVSIGEKEVESALLASPLYIGSLPVWGFIQDELVM